MRKLAVLITMLVGVMFNVVANETVPQGKKVAVLPFAVKGNLDALYAETAQDMFTTELAKSKMYQIVVRSQVDKAMKDLKIQSGNNIDESKAMEIGKIAGTEIVVIGGITALNSQIAVNIRGINVNNGTTEFAEKGIVNSQGELLVTIEGISRKFAGSNDYAAQDYANQSVIINFSSTMTETNQLFVEDYFLGKWGIDPRDTPRVYEKYKKYIHTGIGLSVAGGITTLVGLIMMTAGFANAPEVAGVVVGSTGSVFFGAGVTIASFSIWPFRTASNIKKIHTLVTGKRTFTPRISTTGGFNGENKQLEIALGCNF